MKQIYSVNRDGESESLEVVRCKDEEKELQNLLANNFDLLAGEQISPENPRRWLLIKREMPVPDPVSGGDRWSVDFVFVDHDGIPTFVECKRYNDTRSRREVVGQVIEYAANGQYYWDKDTFIRYAEEASQEINESLNDSLTKIQQDEQLSVDSFFQKVEENLKSGAIRIIFFMEEAPTELKSSTEFLNNQMEKTEVLIIEAQQFKKDDNTRIVVPSLYGYSEQARSVKKATTIRKSQERKKWNRDTFFKFFNENQKRTLGQNISYLLQFVDSNREILKDDYGTGQTPSLIIRDKNGNSIVYIYSNGSIQIAIPIILNNYDIDYIKQVLDKNKEQLPLNAEIEPTKYPSIIKTIDHFTSNDINSIKDILLAFSKEKN